MIISKKDIFKANLIGWPMNRDDSNSEDEVSFEFCSCIHCRMGKIESELSNLKIRGEMPR
jgi:hypothetical protein